MAHYTIIIIIEFQNASTEYPSIYRCFGNYSKFNERRDKTGKPRQIPQSGMREREQLD